MATKNKPYRKLPGGGSFLLTYSRLYLAQDHILQVISTGFTESYIRFYFGDIQMISVRKTHLGKITNAVLGAIALIFSTLLFLPGAEIAGVILVGLFAIPLAFYAAFGASCVTYIQTAVQRQRLTSLGRLPAARKTLNILLPLIEAAQGTLTDEDWQRHADHRAAGPSATASSLEAPPVMSDDAPAAASSTPEPSPPPPGRAE
jgi:hypothetical protein